MCFRTKISLLLLALFVGAGVFSMSVAPVEAVADEYSQDPNVTEAVKKPVASDKLSNLQQYIEQIKAQIAGLQKKLRLAQGEVDPAKWCHNFKQDLRYGDKGIEVKALQAALKKQGFPETLRDAGKGFRNFTAASVVGFQEKYRKQILKPLGLKHGTGFVGKLTRVKLNRLYGCGITPVPPVEKCTPGEKKEYTCPDGTKVDWCTCNNGEKWVCIGSPENQCETQSEEGTQACTDTDGGKDYSVQGTTCRTVASGKTFCRTDICLPNMLQKTLSFLNRDKNKIKGYLKEYYCRGDRMLSRIYRCPNGCEDGACVEDSGELTCRAKCIAEGYHTGICRKWAVTPNAEMGCKEGEKDMGETFDCSVPTNWVGSSKTCCCVPLLDESEQGDLDESEQGDSTEQGTENDDLTGENSTE